MSDRYIHNQNSKHNKYLNILLFILLLSTSGCTKEIKENKFTSLSLISGEFKQTIEAKGIIKPMDEQTISIPDDVWGTLEKIVPEGTKVKKGDFIAKVNVQDLTDNYNGIYERLSNTQIEEARQKANLPVEISKLDNELDLKKIDLKNKSIDYKLLKKGSKENITIKTNVDIDVSKLKLTSTYIDKKRELYKKGYMSQQDSNLSEMEYKTYQHDLGIAEINKIQLGDKYQKPDIDKSKLIEEQAKLDVKINRIENKAHKSALKIKARNSSHKLKHYLSRVKHFEHAIKTAEMYSPIDGVVIYPKIWGWKKAFVGMEVWNGFSFMNISNTEKLKIESKINEQEIINAKVGQSVEIKIPSLANQVFIGKIVKISKLAKFLDERNPEGLKYFDVDISIDNKLHQLKTNMNVNLKIISNRFKKAYYLPVEALVEEGKKNYVYFDQNGSPIKKQVTIKERSQDYILLTDKLTGKEKFYLMPVKENI